MLKGNLAKWGENMTLHDTLHMHQPVIFAIFNIHQEANGCRQSNNDEWPTYSLINNPSTFEKTKQ